MSQPVLGPVGWIRWAWRQLTSMRTALLLLLLLAIVAIPGSLFPQRSSDPNGVTQYFRDNPDTAPFLDNLQLFDVYSSAWFSSIYILLFVSLIGCIIPRTRHHWQALRQRPPRTPVRLERLADFRERTGVAVDAGEAVQSARKLLTTSGYRTEIYTQTARGGQESVSVSAERGYLRETGNLVFHSAMVGVLLAVGVGGGLGYNGQKVVVEGQTLVNTLLDFNSFNPGRFFNTDTLAPYAVSLDSFEAVYETNNLDAYGQPIDYTANVTTTLPDGESAERTVKVNEPLDIAGTNIYLLGNGYAPTITVRDADDRVVFTDSVPFLPQDTNLTSLGVIKVPDGLDTQLGMTGFFYPTAMRLESGAYASSYPDLVYPVLTLNVFQGDLGINEGAPKSVYTLDADGMEQIAGGDSDTAAIELMPGQRSELPNGLGSITFENAAEPDAEVVDVTGDSAQPETGDDAAEDAGADTSGAPATEAPATDAPATGTPAPGEDATADATQAPANPHGGDGTAASGASSTAEGYSGAVKRFASFDVHHDPGQLWVLVFAVLVVAGLITSLLVPRRRVWVKVSSDGEGTVRIQYAGLARGEDPALGAAVAELDRKHARELGLPSDDGAVG
ncbi:cytochrome c biogenesis protein ResB [Mycetocola reblochoni]|uniref:Cytochrome c biogenesis protein ResB n=1 Tax=Mycetocola reblochoni TaxID=331618 RepID=A0A3L6ZTN6_9MICO|nr:cytochrome c biogenesis protein ResB [Mycetocola reblochoni]